VIHKQSFFNSAITGKYDIGPDLPLLYVFFFYHKMMVENAVKKTLSAGRIHLNSKHIHHLLNNFCEAVNL